MTPKPKATTATTAHSAVFTPPDQIEGIDIQVLLSQARQSVIDKTHDSALLDVHAENRIPRFHMDELQLGRILGRGGFCVVSEISKITLHEKRNEESTNGDDTQQQHPNNNNHHSHPVAHDEYFIHNVVQDRSFMEMHCIRTGKDCRYAIKQLQESTFKDRHIFLNGIIDLAIEARFLSVIRHPNIIKMRAMAVGEHYFCSNFFVVLDRLYDILTDRLQQWRKSNPNNRILSFGKKKKTEFWVMRLQVAYDLSCALKYLHDNHVIYRDLKPDNIGFDVRGDVKIFDFGLAKEIDPSKVRQDGLYKLTGDTGSPRYMAPEVGLELPYNEKADVYSFTILIWQILALDTPFGNFTYKMLHTNVFKGSLRPTLQPKWPAGIQRLFNQGWTKNIQERLTMEEVQGLLRDEINNNQDEELSEVLDASRKSEMSARGGS